jgi:acyl-CoA synthetase (AMP-forming)/AMP-acid ligase II
MLEPSDGQADGQAPLSGELCLSGPQVFRGYLDPGAVIGAPGEPSVLGVFVTESADDLDSVRSRLADDLPAYMLPTHIWPISQLQLNQNGKIDQAALRQRSRQLLERAAG